MSLSYQSLAVAVAAGTTGALVAAVAGRSILVHGYYLTGDTASTVGAFKSNGSGGTVISGNLRMAQNGNAQMPPSSIPYFKTAPSESLDLTATTGAISGFILWSVGP